MAAVWVSSLHLVITLAIQVHIPELITTSVIKPHDHQNNQFFCSIRIRHEIEPGMR